MIPIELECFNSYKITILDGLQLLRLSFSKEWPLCNKIKAQVMIFRFYMWEVDAYDKILFIL